MKTFFIRLSAVIFSIALIAPLAASAQTNGKNTPLLLRAQGDSKIYMISNGMRYWLRTGDIFNAYHFSWKAVKEVSQSDINAYPAARVIRKQGETNLYSVENGTKQWIPSPEAFNARGYDWNAIVDVNATDFDKYEAGNPLTQEFPGQTITIDLSPNMNAGAP